MNNDNINLNTENSITNFFSTLFVWFILILILVVIFLLFNISGHLGNELYLDPLPKCKDSIIEYADETKDHLLPESLDDIYLPIPEEKTIDNTTKVIVTEPKKLYMPRISDMTYQAICDKFFNGEDFICNMKDAKKSYEYKVSSDRKQADLYYTYSTPNSTNTKSTHIDITDRYNNKLSIKEHKKIIEEHLNEIERISEIERIKSHEDE